MSLLLSFVQTGTLGPVNLGATRNEVERAFGAPNDWGAALPEMQRSPIWKYGNVELHFDADGKVFLILCDSFDVSSDLPFAFDSAPLGKGTETEVELWLDENEIQFEKTPYPWADGVTMFHAVSGVEIKVYDDVSVFTNETNAALLCSVSRLAR